MRYHQYSIEAMRAEPPRKTQTRRVQNEGERLVYGHYTWEFYNKYGDSFAIARSWGWNDKPTFIFSIPTILDKHGNIKWQVGRRYSINPPPGPGDKGRMGKAIGSFLCTGLRGKWLRHMDGVDCVAEGIEKDLMMGTSGQLLDDFQDLWDSIHPRGKRWIDNPKVWIIGQGEYQWEGK